MVSLVDLNHILRSRPSPSRDLDNDTDLSSDPRPTVPSIGHLGFIRPENFQPLFFGPVEIVSRKLVSLSLILLGKSRFQRDEMTTIPSHF